MLPYLLRALRNTHLTGVRDAGRRPRTVELPSDDNSALRSSFALPEVALEHREVLDPVAGLPDPFRRALVAVDIAGLSYRQAAHALGSRDATIATRVFRAHQRVGRRSRRSVQPLARRRRRSHRARMLARDDPPLAAAHRAASSSASSARS